MSKRYHSKSFSRDGFKPIPGDYEGNMATNDATIDIPLEQVPSNGGGLRNQSSVTGLEPTTTTASQTQKRVWFKGRRQKPDSFGRKKGKVGYDGEEDTVNTMGHVYKRIMNFSTLVCMRRLVLTCSLLTLLIDQILSIRFTSRSSNRHAYRHHSGQ